MKPLNQLDPKSFKCVKQVKSKVLNPNIYPQTLSFLLVYRSAAPYPPVNHKTLSYDIWSCVAHFKPYPVTELQ